MRCTARNTHLRPCVIWPRLTINNYVTETTQKVEHRINTIMYVTLIGGIRMQPHNVYASAIHKSMNAMRAERIGTTSRQLYPWQGKQIIDGRRL